MEKLEIKVGEFVAELGMRCAGMCKGSCSCPTGFCRCKMSESYSWSQVPSAEYFTE